MSDKTRIMVIEDDEGNRRSLARALTREGYQADAFGEAMPMACDDTVWGRGANRRVEVWLD